MDEQIKSLLLTGTLTFLAVAFSFSMRYFSFNSQLLSQISDRRRHREIIHLRRMRFASYIEGLTLLMLIFVAVPFKHLGGYRDFVEIMGPIHGLFFLFYIWVLLQAMNSTCFSKQEILRMALLSIIPFGGLVNERVLYKRELMLAVLR